MNLTVNLTNASYDIIFERSGIGHIDAYWGKGEKTFILTDSGVPEIYSRKVASCCKDAYIHTIPQGEASKEIKYLLEIWQKMCEYSLTRTDRIIAVGGGVVGDIAGLAAATYMRGIKFYNIPTTVLSQVDSSVGGKTAIDFEGYKNIIGAFHQPSGVLIDADTIKTLPKRQISNGLAEAVKMAATHDEELFKRFENADYEDMAQIESLLRDAVNIKREVVQRDEKELGERKALNFGHTLAHALESTLAFDELYHGECVSLGMKVMCSGEVRTRLEKIFDKLSLPSEFPVSPDSLIDICRHDKKCSGDDITIVYVDKIGSFELRKITFSQFADYIKGVSEI
ncbi:MAG: 3-dehydroquinate synthase [Eubacteriaceae bacterium]|nr:3-dehydroquinate synthase [Eubacteriaceae bacterium]